MNRHFDLKNNNEINGDSNKINIDKEGTDDENSSIEIRVITFFFLTKIFIILNFK